MYTKQVRGSESTDGGERSGCGRAGGPFLDAQHHVRAGGPFLDSLASREGRWAISGCPASREGRWAISG